MDNNAKAVVVAYDTLIKSELETAAPGRYRRIQQLAAQAATIAGIFASRVGDVVDEDGDLDEELGIIGGDYSGVRQMARPGRRVNRVIDDQGEMLRQIVAIAQPVMEMQVNSMREKHRGMLLDSLLKWTDIENATKDPAIKAEITERIAALRKEINDGHGQLGPGTTADLVHTELLRGHQPDDGGQDDHEGDVGAPDESRADGDGESGAPRAGEEVENNSGDGRPTGGGADADVRGDERRSVPRPAEYGFTDDPQAAGDNQKQTGQGSETGPGTG